MVVFVTEREQFEMGVAADAVLRLGMMLMGAGTSGYRVIRGMKRTARAMGFDYLDAVVGVTQITCTFHKGERFRTVASQQNHLAVDASRIEALENFTHNLDRKIDAAELNAELDRIESTVRRRWSRLILVCAAAVACAAFAVLNHFTLPEVALVAVAAGSGQWVRSVLASHHVHQLGGVVASGMVASLVFYLLAAGLVPLGFPGIGSLTAGYVAAVLFLVPGFPLFSAMIDLGRFDFDAGLARLAYALVVIFAATFSVALVSGATGLNPQPVAVPSGSIDPAWLALAAAASFLGIAGFAFLFNSSRRMVVVAASIGTVANTLRMLLLELDANGYFAAFCAGMVIGLIGAVAAKKADLPRVTTTVPAAVILIPGTSMFRAVYYLNAGNMNDALSNTATAAMTVLAISMGLVMSRMLTDRDWALGKLIDFDKQLVDGVPPRT